MNKRSLGFGSLCAKERQTPQNTKPHVLPIQPTSSFVFKDIDQSIRVFEGTEEGHVYSRFANPTCDALAEKITALETAGLDVQAHTQLFSSGMAAIHSFVIALLSAGEAILTQGNLYGGTTELLRKIVTKQGIGCHFTDLRDLKRVEEALESDPAIRLVFFESPANPTLACVDLQAIGELCRSRGVTIAIDNTFSTPYLQQPFRFGINFIIHSTTKYLNGHGNATGGALVGTDIQFMKGDLWQVMKLGGASPNPFDCWLTYNGIKTLALRMDRHSSNAMELANFLEGNPKVRQVNYLGLKSHPDHDVASRQMSGYGGMLSFDLEGGLPAGLQFMRNLRFCTFAPTLGDVDTLILHPASSSHLNVDRKLREANGITDGLIRISVGIEDIEDIIEDIGQALDNC
jgi:methionine-gamma-lyase